MRSCIREAFIYGLRDPRIEDPVLSVRYIGQTLVGMERPFRHFREEASLANDGNLHKARWVAQLKAEGLEPEIAVLERIPWNEDRSALKHALDEAEVRLLVEFKEAGASLTNLQSGGASSYVLDDVVKAKISQSKSWKPSAKTFLELDPSIILGDWSRQKAWWLGVTLASLPATLTSFLGVLR